MSLVRPLIFEAPPIVAVKLEPNPKVASKPAFTARIASTGPEHHRARAGHVGHWQVGPAANETAPGRSIVVGSCHRPPAGADWRLGWSWPHGTRSVSRARAQPDDSRVQDSSWPSYCQSAVRLEWIVSNCPRAASARSACTVVRTCESAGPGSGDRSDSVMPAL